MKVTPKRIAYWAIIIILFIIVFPFACVGWICEKIVDKHLDLAIWLQSKLYVNNKMD